MAGGRRPIVLHAGFHKTGTTSAQATILSNGPTLWKTHALLMPKHLSGVLPLAMLYARLGDPVSLDGFRRELAAKLGALDLGKHRGLCLSAEDLCGLMPGRRDKWSYTRAPELVAAAADVITDVIPDANLTIYLSLRKPQPWIKSTYWHNLRRARLRLDFEDYRKSLAPGAKLDRVAQDIAKAARPHVVVTGWLEQTKALPLGPAGPILDLMGIDKATQASLTPTQPLNTSPSAEFVQAMLELNRGPLAGDAYDAARDGLLASSKLAD